MMQRPSDTVSDDPSSIESRCVQNDETEQLVPDSDIKEDVARMVSKGLPHDDAVACAKDKLKYARKLLQRSDGSGRCVGCALLEADPQPSHHHSCINLRASAGAGCDLCQLFLDSLQNANAHIDVAGEIKVDRNKLYYTFVRRTVQVFEFFVPRDAAKDGCVYNALRDVQRSPDSTPCYVLARKWLQQCTESHQRCALPNKTNPPRRLLDLTGAKIRLRPSCDIPEKWPEYVALSYCWGNQQNLRTTKDSLVIFQREIMTSELPITVLDAVRVTRELGLSYLWVDALCIIQDSPEDWEAECERMGDYYRYSHLTLSVLNCQNVNDGFLNRSRDIPSTPWSSDRSIWIRKKLPTQNEVFRSAALNKRGWTFQERLLATRILHYSDSELFWECQTCSAREGSAEEYNSLVHSNGEDFKRALSSLSDGRFSFEHGVLTLWYRIVKHYTQRSFSQCLDKLPAISGVAAMIEKKLERRYSIGLWEEDLHGLAWCRDEKGYEDPIKTIEGIPSWSWASLDGPITYPFFEKKFTSSANDTTMIKFTDPRDGVLTLKTLFKSVWCGLGWMYEHDRGSPPLKLKPYSGVKDQVRIPHPYRSHRANFPYDVFDAQGTCGMASFDQYNPIKKQQSCSAIRICESVYERAKRQNSFWDPGPVNMPALETSVYFLLIMPDDKRRGAWRRIGMGIAVSGTAHPWQEHANLFDDCEWKLVQIV